MFLSRMRIRKARRRRPAAAIAASGGRWSSSWGTAHQREASLLLDTYLAAFLLPKSIRFRRFGALRPDLQDAIRNRCSYVRFGARFRALVLHRAFPAPLR